MKYILALALCFVFVSLAAGQGYGRVRKPGVHPKPKPVFHHNQVVHPKPVVHKPVVHPKPVVHKPVVRPKPVVTDQWTMSNPIEILNGGGLDMLPPDIQRIIGSTFSGMEIRGGMGEFPQHGGSGTDPSGLRNGWGADPNEIPNQAVLNWEDPWNSAAYPVDFAGQELIFDPARNRFNFKHHQAKEQQHMRVKNGGGLMSGGIQAEHNIVKEANHMANKAIGGINPGVGHVVNPVGHHVEKKIVGQQNHNVVKSGIILAGKPSYLRRGPNNAGVVGHNNPALISHNIDKATLGANSIIGHNIAKSSGPAVGVGFINPNDHVAEKNRVNHMGHKMAKSTGGAMLGRPIGGGYIGLSQLGGLNTGLVGHNRHGVVGHNIAKATGNRVGTGFINGGGHVQHNIVKSSMGGVHGGGQSANMIGVNPVAHQAAKVQHNIVKSSMGGVHGGGHSANMIGVNPVAHQAAKVQHNVVKSSMGGVHGGGHVANMMAVNQVAHQATGVQHNIVKSSMGGVRPIGGAVNGQFGMFPEDPVHNVHKVSKSGIAAMGHDPLARNIGHGIAKQVIGESANAVNIGSNGGVSAGNPVAIAATHGLAKESLHVAGKTLNIASESNPIRPNGPIGVGNNIFGGIHPKPIHPKPFHPKPVVKPPPKFQTGYGRTRKL